MRSICRIFLFFRCLKEVDPFSCFVLRTGKRKKRALFDLRPQKNNRTITHALRRPAPKGDFRCVRFAALPFRERPAAQTRHPKKAVSVFCRVFYVCPFFSKFRKHSFPARCDRFPVVLCRCLESNRLIKTPVPLKRTTL